jgi:hypothetical protein
MTIEDARITLASIDYRDGFKLQLLPMFPNGEEALLKMTHVTSDTSNLSNIGTQSKGVTVAIGKMTESDLVHKVFAEILAWEAHEACEFFRFEGVQIFSPHANVHDLRTALAPKART